MSDDPRPRTSFGTIYCLVHAYPSIGGLIRAELTAAELAWLGLSRTESSLSSPNPSTEDAFAT